MPTTYGAKPSVSVVSVDVGKDLVVGAAEVDVRELEREVRVHAPAAEDLPGRVVAVVAVDRFIDVVEVVDLDVEGADAGAGVETRLVVLRLRARCSCKGRKPPGRR